MWLAKKKQTAAASWGWSDAQKNAEKAPEGFTLGGFFCGLLYERFIFQASAGSV